MIDYNSSQNESSLIGMLKQGGGIVNLSENQTIEGLKTFKQQLNVFNENEFRGLQFGTKKVYLPGGDTAVPDNSWIRVGAWNSYGAISIIFVSSRIGIYLETQACFIVSLARDTVALNKLSVTPVIGDIDAVRAVVCGQNMDASAHRYLEFRVPVGDLTVIDGVDNMVVSHITCGRVTTFDIYDAFEIGSIPENYTEHILYFNQN